MNRTSTKVLYWEQDCEQFRQANRPFELRDVATAEHRQFVKDFRHTHNWNTEERGRTVIFTPPAAP